MRWTIPLALSMLCVAGPVSAVSVEWPVSSGGNGNYYEVVSVPLGVLWTDAKLAAEAAGGHLATPTSAAENSFIFSLADEPIYWAQESGGSNLGPWLGGFQTADDGSTPNDNWTWVTGETWDFTHWASGEPNNFVGEAEDYLSYKCTAGCRSDDWNDLPDDVSAFSTAVVSYVVEWSSCSTASTTSEDQRLHASDPTAGAGFGPVAMDGSRAIVGAAAVTSGGLGAAYIMEHGGSSWTEVSKIQSSDNQSGDKFGTGVDVSGDYAIVGANFDDGEIGAAYIFERDGLGNWNETQKLVASDGGLGDSFGIKVAISGSYAIVGAHKEDGGAGDPLAGAGAAYLFERDGFGAWNQVAKLSASDAQAANTFGIRVGIEGDVAVVSAQRGEAGAIVDAGAVYVFERSALGAWAEVQKLSASDGQPSDFFGSGVATSGGTILVGAKDEDGGSGDPTPAGGAAYVFERDELGVWNEVVKLQSCDAQAGDAFGMAVDVRGPVAVVGARNEGGGPGGSLVDAGAAYVFDGVVPGSWLASEKLVASDAQDGDIFGRAVATNGAQLLVGAVREDGGLGEPFPDGGAVYAFESTVAVSVVEGLGDAAEQAATLHLSVAPNPFSATTQIQFQLRASEPVDISVFDVRGRRIRHLASGRRFEAGNHRIVWDGLDASGNEVSSGVYFYQVVSPSARETRKAILVR